MTATPRLLHDREADIWEPLFAIASVAVPNRVGELKQIALNLSGEKRSLDVDESEGLRLLADIRTVFEKSQITNIHTDDLLLELKTFRESPWEELKATKLAKLLRPFAISSRQVWIKKENRRGYDVDDFTKVFEAYVPKR